jgi:hypothetical protein
MKVPAKVLRVVSGCSGMLFGGRPMLLESIGYENCCYGMQEVTTGDAPHELGHDIRRGLACYHTPCWTSRPERIGRDARILLVRSFFVQFPRATRLILAPTPGVKVTRRLPLSRINNSKFPICKYVFCG